jgi:glycerate 2-kinase
MSLREDVGNIYKSCLSKLDPADTVYTYLKNNSDLFNNYKRVYPIAFGKASTTMMKGCLDFITKEIPDIEIVSDPVVVSTKSDFKIPYKVDLHFSSHPVPDNKSIQAGEKVLSYLSSSTKDDLVLFLISGGGSSLLAKPAPSILLNDKVKLTDLLLKSGASINEMNAVRKHMSSIKGGRLSQHALPSNCHSLIISDVINDDISTIASGPTVEDKTTYQNAYDILSKYNLLEICPKSIMEYLKKGVAKLVEESPSKIDNSTNNIICSNKLFREQLSLSSKKLGYKPIVIDEDFVGEAKFEAISLINKLIDISSRYPHEKLAIISGGETVVDMKGSGKGGRNQELALSFLANADKLPSSLDWLLLSIGTDGIDGPTDAAGGIIDNTSIKALLKSNLNIHEYLDNNDSYTFLDSISSLYKTGPSGTNVADIQIILINR